MLNISKTLSRTLLGAAAAVAIAAASFAAPASAETTYAVPTAPEVTSATVVQGGVKVTWKAATAEPKVTNYVITGGVGSCPVIVPASAHSAVIPALNKNDLYISVLASNAYGLSPAGTWDEAITPKTIARSTIKSVQVLQLSDFHGAIETTSSNIGAPILATAFAEERKNVAATVTLSSGDNIGAAPVISSAFDEMPTIEEMNAMKFDASTFGNHEHDKNLTHLKSVIAASDFKWVVSNYDTVSPLKASATKFASKFTIINRGGVKIGVVGMNTPETVDTTFPGNLDYATGKSIKIQAGTGSTVAAIQAAKKAGADLVIALDHEGWTQSLAGKALGGLVEDAKALSGAAVVFGGHSHQQFTSVINGRLTAEVKNAGVQYTRTQICVDTAKNRVLGSSIDYINKADVPATYNADATADAIATKYKSQITAKYDVKIGVMSAIAPRGGTPAVERSSEAALGSYAADAVRAKYNTDLVLLNGGGIRDTFPAATYKPADTSLRRPATGSTGPYDVTLGDAYAVFPFGNSVSIASLTGEGIWAALENGVSQYPSAGRWPQVSGIKFTVDTTKAAGSRITAVTKTDGTAIAKDSKVYSVATVDYMVYGGDGYTQFDPSKVSVRDLLVDVFADALKKDLAAGKTTVMATDGRITVIK
ncbi:5'-nucleotidase C-terminal domain-containing protein [Rhodoluna sp.]|uniref:bifunctional metallophosphatase/5'-nucleotidase n=1 Tax=Rhodoluna sp. TaxID=1969481 RepID=UPI0025CE5E5D|nr:5'-nucleotidase C-terminal domain-containing protein [Rhodoluna sp.]